MLDPACLFLHHPDVLVAILYRPPATAFDRFMDFVIREELFFNVQARRHFFWYVNVLFLEDIPTARVPTLVVLATDDVVVPVRNALRYVEAFNQGKRLEDAANPSGPVDLVVLENAGHGDFLFNEKLGWDVANGVKRCVDRLDAMGV